MKTILSIICLYIIAIPAYAKMKVTVSILPQQYFVKKIAGDRVDVNVMVLPGNSPATYEPKPRQMSALSASSLYFAVGAPFEAVWLKRIASANKRMKVIHTEKGIIKQPMVSHNHHKVEHEGDHHDVHEKEKEILDPHVWVSPTLVKLQVEHILNALISVDPDGATDYRVNFDMFMVEIDELDRLIRQMLSSVDGKKFMVFHPSWGYFAKDYGLTQIPVEVEGKSPSPRELVNLIHEAKEEKIKVIFVQPQFSKKSADTIAKQIGGRTIEANPLAKDWRKNLLDIASVFQKELK